MPSKALLRPPELYGEARRVPGVRGRSPATSTRASCCGAVTRSSTVSTTLDRSRGCRERGVTIVRGRGRLDGERRVRVGDDVLVAREAVIVAIGSQALLPPIPGLVEGGPWTNRKATTSERIPPRLLVLGGGVVGVEPARAFASLGSRVTLVEAASRILARARSRSPPRRSVLHPTSAQDPDRAPVGMSGAVSDAQRNLAQAAGGFRAG
jgi:dihydrolipoamide dehydrogenase